MNNTIREHLQTQTKDWLVERLSEFAMDDDSNADRILLYLAAQNNDEDVFADFKAKIDKAIKQIRDHGPGHWKNKLPLRGLNNIADALAEVWLKGKYMAVLEIAEYALLKIDSISGLQDECELDYLIDTFRHLHLDACYKLKPAPEHFGAHLAKLANQSEWGLFDGPPSGYAEVLGQTGLSAYAAGFKNK